jgi:tetratricopeptide (TPR) repeat protein
VLENPGVAGYQSGLAEVDLYCRRYDEATREFTKALDLGRAPANVYFNLGDIYFYQGQYAKARTMYEKTASKPGWAYVPLGSRTEARRQVSTLLATWARGDAKPWTAWTLARLYTTLGDREQALGWLERAYEARDGMVVYLKVYPHFDPLRGEPRFQRLLREIGLAN